VEVNKLLGCLALGLTLVIVNALDLWVLAWMRAGDVPRVGERPTRDGWSDGEPHLWRHMLPPVMTS
jgi:hypothetical protein